MRSRILFVALALILSIVSIAQKRVVVIGSSTAAGFGTSDTSKSWVNLTQRYWKELGAIDTNIINMAIGGLTTYNGLPMGYISPLDPGDGSRGAPLPSESVSTALLYNPDVVLVAFASNDIGDGYSKAEYLYNLRVISDFVHAAGKICYIASTQPRTSFSQGLQDSLLEVRDSILAEFAPYALDFYSPVVSPDSLTINPVYAYTDGIHLDDAGHQQLFTVVKNDLILTPVPLPLTLTSFTAQRQQQAVLLKWTDQEEDAPTSFGIQRSTTGSNFETVQILKGQGGKQTDNYSWTDQHPLSGGSFYRLRIDEPGKESFSPVISIGDNSKLLALDKLFDQGTQLMAGINTPKDQQLFFTILDRAGGVISRRSYAVSAPYGIVPLSLANLAIGEYFLKVDGPNGFSVTRPFARF